MGKSKFFLLHWGDTIKIKIFYVYNSSACDHCSLFHFTWIMDIKLLGYCIRFAPTLIKWYYQLANIMIPPPITWLIPDDEYQQPKMSTKFPLCTISMYFISITFKHYTTSRATIEEKYLLRVFSKKAHFHKILIKLSRYIHVTNRYCCS